jgi:hypothetical protein
LNLPDLRILTSNTIEDHADIAGPHDQGKMVGMADSAGGLLHLVDLLPRRPGLSGRELAEELGVTVRTVHRDVDRLRRLDYSVEAAPGPSGGGCRLGVGVSLPPPVLDDAEAMAVAVGLDQISASVGSPEPRGRPSPPAKLAELLRFAYRAADGTSSDRPGRNVPVADPLSARAKGILLSSWAACLG